jgi:methylmalonyl-CoA epimerase (EC 5.1.99.1)
VKVKKIDHIGVAVKSIGEAKKIYEGFLGLKVTELETVAEQKVTTAFLPAGESEIELLESTSPDGAVAKFIDSKGEGMQHIAFAVENIEGALKELKDKGVRLIDEKPRKGAGGKKIAFIHPKETGGVLIELCEKAKE